jgi:hypothetical protein
MLPLKGRVVVQEAVAAIRAFIHVHPHRLGDQGASPSEVIGLGRLAKQFVDFGLAPIAAGGRVRRLDPMTVQVRLALGIF